VGEIGLMTKAGNLKSRLYGLLATLFLLPGWFGAPVSLYARPSDVCAMPCCVQQGHCCCRTRHARVKGHPFTDKEEINSRAFLTSCPQGCNNNSFSSESVSIGSTKTLPSKINLVHPVRSCFRNQIFFTGLLWASRSSGRAPPEII